MINVKRLFPITIWASQYNRAIFSNDLVAAMIVTIMIIPQSLAYALLAGLPPEIGLYSTILPLLVYAFLGSSKTLSVGPVAITSLLTLTALSEVATGNSSTYISAAITLAMLSGAILLLLGFFKLGFVSNYLSRPVLTGFISSAAILIALSQSKHLLGVEANGSNLIALIQSLRATLASTNYTTLVIGLALLTFLFIAKAKGLLLIKSLGVGDKVSQVIVKAAPFIAVSLSSFIVYSLNLHETGVSIVGDIPNKLPSLSLPVINLSLVEQLLVPAFIIALISYVESLSIGKALASKRREKIQSNQELVALGSANLASAISGGFPVAGGLSRSVVNFEAGAQTQAASIYTAFGVAIATVLFAPFLFYLPKVTLAVIIIIAVTPLINLSAIREMWLYSKDDFYAALITILTTFLIGIEAGVICGILASLSLYLYKTSTPHIAEVGLVDGTEIFRNIKRYKVLTDPNILNLRVDEGLYFANECYLEDIILNRIYEDDKISHVVLMCNAVNDIDFSALKMLENLNKSLLEQGIVLHMSEVKGPVLDKLESSAFLQELSGNIYQAQYDAYIDLRNSNLPVRIA